MSEVHGSSYGVLGTPRILSTNPSKVACGQCGYNNISTQESWKGPLRGYVGGEACRHCGTHLPHKFLSVSKTRRTHEVTCSTCRNSREEEIKWAQVYIDGDPFDPYFGYELWYQGNIKGNTLWAYNKEHLIFIQKYCSAKLRIRAPNIKRSLAANLPSWLLASKNRTAAILEIEKMLKK